MKKDSKLCNFRLSYEAVDCLVRLSDQWTCSMTEVVERSLLIAEAAVIAAPEATGEPSREAPPKQSAPKVSGRAESVAQRRAREAKEHAAKLADADTMARMTGRDDIEYDLENVPHRSVVQDALPPKQPREVHGITKPRREAKPLLRPHGTTEAKRRREQ